MDFVFKILEYLISHRVKLFVFLILMFFFLIWLPNPLFNSANSTVLIDKNNELLAAKIATDGQWRFPQSDSVPQKFKHCIITFEDEYFYNHPGFNPISIVKSIKRNINAGRVKSGGSTITMQLARMIRKNRSRTYFTTKKRFKS